MASDSRAKLTGSISKAFPVICGISVILFCGALGSGALPIRSLYISDCIVIGDPETESSIKLGKLSDSTFGWSLWDTSSQQSRAGTEVDQNGQVHFSLYDQRGNTRVMATVDDEDYGGVGVRSSDGRSMIWITSSATGPVVLDVRRTVGGQELRAMYTVGEDGLVELPERRGGAFQAPPSERHGKR